MTGNSSFSIDEKPDVPSDAGARPLLPAVSGAMLVLGTAQLAAPYGSAVRVSPPDRDEAMQVVRAAIRGGAIAIDTARAYLGAEETLGKALADGWGDRVKVVTKLSPLQDLAADITPQAAADAAERSVFQSLEALGCARPWLLLHRADHLDAWGGAIWDRLKALKQRGLVAGLGVSVQAPEQALAAADEPDVELIQLPFNILDWRWRKAGVPEALTRRPDLEVHARSVYLQGILLRNTAQWPPIAGLEAEKISMAIRDLVTVLERDSVADLCLAYVTAMPWLKGVVIGMERLAQLNENIKLLSNRPLDDDGVQLVQSSLQAVPAELLDPSKWPPLPGDPGRRTG